MKFKVGDNIIVTIGKDKGKKGSIVAVFPKKDKVVVSGVNLVVKHRKPIAGQSGDKFTIEKPIATAKIAIVNDKGQPDRIGYVVDKKGQKNRVFKKTGAIVPDNTGKTK